ncbi:MAG: hypothetical protein Q9213_003155 [Squamulea squamosa]
MSPDGSRLKWNNGDILGVGLFGVVLRYGDHALKIPKWIQTTDASEEEAEFERYDYEGNLECFETEKAVYTRAGPYHGIAELINISLEGIRMVRYDRGDLEDYIKNNPKPDTSQQIEWIKSLVGTLHHLHKCKILIDDMALRNILIADDMSLKLIDFGSCTIFPLDADITKVQDENGQSVKADIFNLGNIIYSIVKWEKFHFNLYAHFRYALPLTSELPDLSSVLFEELIRNCWAGHYNDAYQLQCDAERLCKLRL